MGGALAGHDPHFGNAAFGRELAGQLRCPAEQRHGAKLVLLRLERLEVPVLRGRECADVEVVEDESVALTYDFGCGVDPAARDTLVEPLPDRHAPFI
jgi:hypothetical protein